MSTHIRTIRKVSVALISFARPIGAQWSASPALALGIAMPTGALGRAVQEGVAVKAGLWMRAPNIMHRQLVLSLRSLRNLIRATVVLACGMVLSTSPLLAQSKAAGSRSPTRIAIYNSRVLFDSIPERTVVESTFAQEQDHARGLVKAASDSLRLALDDLVRSEAQLTPLEREAAKLHLRARELLVEQMIENLDAVFQRRHAELRQPLLSRIREAVHAVRIREGYHIAIDRAGEGLEMDVDASIDITVAVLTELRRARGQTSMRATPQSASANSPGFARFRPFVLPSHTSAGATNGVGSRLRSASSP